MITSTTIAPPVNPFELGAKVEYHHRAGVARIAPLNGPFKQPSGQRSLYGWKLFEGARKNEWSGPTTVVDGMELDTTFVREMFFDYPKTGRNKTVFIWPDKGNGIIIGLVRRGIGTAVGNSYSDYDHEFEPGYFDLDTWVWLYLVKTQLAGSEFVMCPLDAVHRVWS
jgi:hypothetical protein